MHLQAKKRLGSAFRRFPVFDSALVPNLSNKRGTPVLSYGGSSGRHVKAGKQNGMKKEKLAQWQKHNDIPRWKMVYRKDE